MTSIDSLFVPALQPALKHSTILKKFDDLKSGESFLLINDHDPIPLYYEMKAEKGESFEWKQIENGPEVWKVEIIRNFSSAWLVSPLPENKKETKTETIGEMVAKDLRKAEVFKKYGIDFCCGGKKSLKQVCEEKGLDMEIVEAELDNSTQTVSSANDYNRWEPDFLAGYIYNQHHLYYYIETPVIKNLLTRVMDHHGNNHPELKYLYSLFSQLVQELDAHFIREEKIVFPFIKALTLAAKNGDFTVLNSQPSLTEPIKIMEADHEAAGAILAEMQNLSNNYMPPADACNSYQFLYKKLKNLDEDLHQHIHLENNILFPKALEIEKELLF